jgi:single-stranded DNA-binding protein
MQTRSWESEEKGRQYRTEIVAEMVQFGPRPAQERATTASDSPEQVEAGQDGIEYPTEDINPDDIPF